MYKVYYYSGSTTALDKMQTKEFSTLVEATT